MGGMRRAPLPGGAKPLPAARVTFAMGGREPASAEDHGLVAVEDDAVLAVPLDGAGQHLALGVAAAGREVLHGVGVVGAGHVLLDDRALVQVGRPIVGRVANQLHAAVMGLVVGLGALEIGRAHV